MDSSIASILLLDGLTNGAIYALLGISIVLVFAVTRIIFIPQGEFVTYGTLTYAIFQAGQVPGTVWLLLILASVAAMMELATIRTARQQPAVATKAALRMLVPPVLIGTVSIWAGGAALPPLVYAVLTVCIVASFGPLVHRIAFQSLADESTLVLLIVSVGIHFAMTGLGLLFFGAEGFRNLPFWDEQFPLGAVVIGGQSLLIFITSAALIVLLWLFFEKSIYGKALRATAVNRLGARLMAISTQTAGSLTFLMAGMIGALSGLLIGPTTTIFYDSGFLIGLKGFVAAVIAGLLSYPGALFGALAVGIIESFGSFWASAFKEVIVFTIIVPVLLWRSLRNPSTDEEH